MPQIDRLPLNFHQTFIPERRYISELIKNLDDDFTGSDRELADKTGIPMGKSSGKLPAILAYSKAMGIINVEGRSPRVITLTSLGKMISNEDLYLSEQVTQWILHLGLTRRIGGADLWYQIFNRAPLALSPEFTSEQLIFFLERIYSKDGKSCIGPAFRTYEDPAGLNLVDVVDRSIKEDLIRIKSAPMFESFCFMYAYLLFSEWENSKHQNENQLTVFQYNETTRFFNQLNFNQRQVEDLLVLLEENDTIKIDKHMSPWIISRVESADSFLLRLFELV